jgi:hypothetical protein
MRRNKLLKYDQSIDAHVLVFCTKLVHFKSRQRIYIPIEIASGERSFVMAQGTQYEAIHGLTNLRKKKKKTRRGITLYKEREIVNFLIKQRDQSPPAPR